MYVKQLYHQSKFWWIVIILFATGQLFVNYKRGLLFSPFYHYGMFSGEVLPQPQYEVVEILADGKMLQAKDFTANEWDNLVLPLLLFRRQQNWNSHLFNNEISRLLPLRDSSGYVNHLSQQQFDAWYRHHVAGIAKLPANAVVQYRFATYYQKKYKLYRP